MDERGHSDFCESTLDLSFPFSGEMSVLTALSRKKSSRDFFFFFLHLTMMELEHAQKLAEKQIEFYLRASPCTVSDPQSTPTADSFEAYLRHHVMSHLSIALLSQRGKHYL